MTARRMATVLIGSEIGLAALFGVTGALHGFHGVAYAEPASSINLTDIHNVDMFARCTEEDCSDQPGQVGIWTDRDTGNQYLELGETQPAFLIVDNTTGAPMV